MALTVRAVNNVPGVWLEAAVWGGERSEGGTALSGSLSRPLPSHTIFIQGWESDAGTSGVTQLNSF